MNFTAVHESAACSHLATTLGHIVWQGALVAIATFVALKFLRSRSAQSRYVVCAASLLLMLACLPTTLMIMAGREASGASDSASARDRSEMHRSGLTSEMAILERLEQQLSSNSSKRPESAKWEGNTGSAANFDEPADGGHWRSQGTEFQHSSDHGETRASGGSITVAVAVSGAYLLGVLLMAGRLFLAAWGGQRLRRDANAVTQADLTVSIHRAANDLSMHRVPLIAIARRVSSPVVIGFLRPIILLPVTVSSGLTPDQFRAVISHELAHIRRHDHIVLLFQRLIEALLFFHPAVWIISRRMRIERERCCDDAVLAAGTQRMTYVQSLLRVAELRLL